MMGSDVGCSQQESAVKKVSGTVLGINLTPINLGFEATLEN